ncbi:MAG: DUF5698 domain-containing protein [Actinomycetota bacterium]|nr:DUF5698 domain-containing protein [Actinomycetota bacterium]
MNILFWSLMIFFGRIIDVSLGTIRINFIVRRKKTIAAIVGFVEVIIFVAIIAKVIQDIDNNLYGILAYGAGFAIGTIIGMYISDKFSRDLLSTNIISKFKSEEIESTLRDEGFGATSYYGFGKDGNIKIINVVCRSNCMNSLHKTILKIDPNSFITSSLIGSQRGGFIFNIKKK